MEKRFKNLTDWKKVWQHSADVEALQHSMNQIDKLYEEVRNSIGRVLMSMEMIEIQEIIENRIEALTTQQKTRVAA
jgi:hypothetical protein